MQVAAFDFDDSCYHFFAHDVAVAVTQLRKAGLEGLTQAAELEEIFIKQYLFSRSSRNMAIGKNLGGGEGEEAHSECKGQSNTTEEEGDSEEGRERQLRAWLPHLVSYRASLIICWASAEKISGKLAGPAGEEWFAKSLPIYRSMVQVTKNAIAS